MPYNLAMMKEQFTDLSAQFLWPLRIVITGDTHNLSKSNDPLPELTKQIRKLHPDIIFHTGDICGRNMLCSLEDITKVYSVRGNRDLLLWNSLPAIIHFTFDGIQLSLVHGQGNFLMYLWMKFRYTFFNITNDERIRMLPKSCKSADIVIFGHSHIPLLRQRNHQMFLNPGSGYRDFHMAGCEEPSLILIDFINPQNIQFRLIQQTENGIWHDSCIKKASRFFFCKGDTL